MKKTIKFGNEGLEFGILKGITIEKFGNKTN